MTRYRKIIVQEINREKTRIHKILQDCNIKTTSCLSDIFGVTEREILKRILENKMIKRSEIEVKEYRKEIEILNTIQGINKNAASIIVAEIGTDMGQL